MLRMKKPKPTPSTDRDKVRPGRQHWWWRENRLKRALNENRRLDQLFYWKLKGRKSLSTDLGKYRIAGIENTDSFFDLGNCRR